MKGNRHSIGPIRLLSAFACSAFALSSLWGAYLWWRG